MIRLEAKSEQGWPFTFYIEKAIPIEEDGHLVVEGIASTVNVDHDNERMGEMALQSMANIINDKGVPLRLEHSKEDSAVIGTVFKAWVDERNQLWIRAAMNEGNEVGKMIHESLKQGTKFGLSVGGRVKNAVRELSEATGKMVKTFYDVMLDEVSVTRRPANYDAWLFAKSYKEKDEDVTPFLKSSLYNEFLFENQQLDYLRQFAKSIPDEAWSKEIIKNNSSHKNMDKDKKKEVEESTEKSYVTKGEFTQFAQTVKSGFEGMMKALNDMKGSAKDAVNPDKSKQEEATQQTAKAREGQEDAGGNGDEGATGKKETDTGAKDQAQPEKAKPKEETQQTAKAEDGKKEDAKDEKKEKAEDGKKGEGEEKTKAEEKEGDEKDEKKEKASKDEEDGEDSMKSIRDATAAIANMAKNGFSKSADKGPHPLDTFAATVAMAIDGLTEKFEKSGTRVPGLASMIADLIKKDSSIQEAIVDMAKMPGFKKSMAFGTPFMVTKEGKRFSLTATPIGGEKVEKSTKDQSFKEVWKSGYTSK